MSQLRDKVIKEIIRVEGGYVNDPSDSGGETKYGITKEVARRYGYAGSMTSLPESLAYQIYVDKYWNALNLDLIENESELIAEELADTGVNQGVGRAGEFLQRSLNVLNNQGKLWLDLKVDGAVGPRTVAALRSFLKLRGVEGEAVLYRMLNALQGEFYVSLAERRQKDEKYVYGWFLNRVR